MKEPMKKYVLKDMYNYRQWRRICEEGKYYVCDHESEEGKLLMKRRQWSIDIWYEGDIEMKANDNDICIKWH